MSKEDVIEIEGIVVEKLPNAQGRIREWTSGISAY